MFFHSDAPVCKAESTVIRAALKQMIRIPCDVDANPLYNLTYKWHFNNSLETIVELPEKSSGIMMMTTIQPSALPSSVYMPNQQKKKINRRVSRRALSYGRSSAGSGEWPFDDEDLGDYDDGVGGGGDDADEDDNDNNIPYTQMLLGNRDQLKRKHHPQQQQQHHMMNMKAKHVSVGENDTTEKGKHLLHSSHHQHQQQLNNVYEYYVETYESFGAVSCVASNSNGHSQPCWYHLQPAGEFIFLCIHILIFIYTKNCHYFH